MQKKMTTLLKTTNIYGKGKRERGRVRQRKRERKKEREREWMPYKNNIPLK